jgi:hypothetical protein
VRFWESTRYNIQSTITRDSGQMSTSSLFCRIDAGDEARPPASVINLRTSFLLYCSDFLSSKRGTDNIQAVAFDPLIAFSLIFPRTHGFRSTTIPAVINNDNGKLKRGTGVNRKQRTAWVLLGVHLLAELAFELLRGGRVLSQRRMGNGAQHYQEHTPQMRTQQHGLER